MNIKESKNQIKNSIIAYLTKDDLGSYRIPMEKQRPIFLIGPPGIGKTAIMAQIAEELNIGLVAYSMTHHTRQSALGLPFIVHREYDHEEVAVSEYTMSEIVASIYNAMEESGVQEGILFLDEINCVSETLAPVMLQFLQYKIFGKHRIPEGWVIVTAGNPPEYNKSVREFDMATWDRLKRMDIEPDFEVWREYAIDRGVHPAVLTFLKIKKDCFYSIETHGGRKEFVTARGWDDLSTIIQVYESQGMEVDQDLISQYLQSTAIARDFSIYYTLFNKHLKDYQIEKVLSGKASEGALKRIREGSFDEKLEFLGMVLDSLGTRTREVLEDEDTVIELLMELKDVKSKIVGQRDVDVLAVFKESMDKIDTLLKQGRLAGNMSKEKERIYRRVNRWLKKESEVVADEKDGDKAFEIIKRDYDQDKGAMQERIKAHGEVFSNVFDFLEDAFGDGEEILIFITELTLNKDISRFISLHGCEEYFKHSKELLFYERHREIIEDLEKLELDS